MFIDSISSHSHDSYILNLLLIAKDVTLSSFELNGIPCIPFSAGQPHDDQLLEVLLPLLKQLSQQGDVRPVLYEKFHMPEWFQKHGIPASCWATHG
nr:CTD nuclear envelope phosphatase 1 homolog [Tanacetum cinerariifolium]